ncbi:MAG: hypothetical protein Q8940_21110, partial [Bacteroidota bacterium]|nr:hypothetical protein [Bacteroidota bacterium]
MNQVYAKLPYSLQFAAINFYGLNVRRKRYTPKFKNILEQYKKIDKQAVHYLNFSRIKDITEGSPFYSIDGPESFYKLPLLTKDLAARFYEKIVNKDHMITSLSTSGTTSAPFRMPVSRDFIYNQWAVFWKFRMIHGLNLDSWCAYFIGKPVVAKERITPPYWIKSYPTKQLLFSIFHINRNTVESYLDEIKKNKIRWLHAYPSVLNLLAELIEEKGLFKKAKELGLSLITTSSEVLLELQKNNIESIFGCRIRQLY